MDQQIVRKRRGRNRPQQTTGVLVRTINDARGIAEPLERYGELLSGQIVGLYNAIHGLPATSRHVLARLKQLFHETEGLPATAKILMRPEYQWRYGFNHQTVYRRAPGTARLLLQMGLYDQTALAWAGASRMVQGGTDPHHGPSEHDAALSLIMSSLEISIRACPDLSFITHVEIIKNASAEAKQSPKPLSIPIGTLAHEFAPERRVEIAGAHVKPDAMFGIKYPPGDDPDYRFFALEYDRSTEDVEPSKNLARSSWLRKLLAYSAVSGGPVPRYTSYLKIPNLIVLCLFSDRARMVNVMRLVERCATDPRQFLFKTIQPVHQFLTSAPLPQLLDEPWERIGGSFNISRLERR
jgi:hypothetical protein